jgi:hypothetical protein
MQYQGKFRSDLSRAGLFFASAACLAWLGCAGTVGDSGGETSTGGSGGSAGDSRRTGGHNGGGGSGGGDVGGAAGMTAGNTGGRTGGTGGVTGAGGGAGAGGATGVGGKGTGGATGVGGKGSGGMTGGLGGITGGAGGVLGTCPLFTPDDLWNADVSGKAVDTTNTTKMQALLGPVNIHPDFGSDFGIPINTVPATQPLLPVKFNQFADESDPGPYPFPSATMAIIEGGTPTTCDGDCHLLTVQLGTCQLYEGWICQYSNGWTCANGAHWDLTKKSQGQRPDGWTSADAAGLPIYAGLARYSEFQAGAINHAIRFTLPCTSANTVAPATHEAVPGGCSGNSNAPPMGLRIRLKASFDISTFSAQSKAFLTAFKKYGLILADNGGSSSTLFFQSEQNSNWSDTQINELKKVPASAFEAVLP